MKYCGGVAVSCHPHLQDVWKVAQEKLTSKGILTNFHLIISDLESIAYFKDIYDAYKGKIDYFVLLPYITMGRAEPKIVNHEALFTVLRKYDNISDVAFGAHFYGALKVNNEFGVSLYEPEILSKYLDVKDMTIYNSSFETEPINFYK